MNKSVALQAYPGMQIRVTQASEVKLLVNHRHVVIAQMSRFAELLVFQRMLTMGDLALKVKRQGNQRHVKDVQTKTSVQVVKQKKKTLTLMRLESDVLKSKTSC